MTHFNPEEILRRELRAAAESVEPAADGLTQIRARLTRPRPLAIAWLMVGWTTIAQPALLRLDEIFMVAVGWLGTVLRPVAHWLQPAAERLHPVAERLRPAFVKLRAVFTPRTERSGRPSRYAWLRPALAMAAVVVVAIAGGFALSGLPRQIQQAGESIFSSQSHGSGSGGRAPGVAGHGNPYKPTPGASSSPSPSPSASCTPSPTPSPSTTPTPRVTPSPTPTPTPTPTTPTPTPTAPTPTPTDSDGGLTSPPSGSQAAQDTSDLTIAGPAHAGSADKPRPSASPSCTPGAS